MIGVEQLARLRLQIEAASRDEVLARHGISVTEWLTAQRHWLDIFANGEGTEQQRSAYVRLICGLRGSSATRRPNAREAQPTAPAVDETAVLDAPPSERAVHPFASSPAAPPAPIADAVAAEASDLLGETVTVAALSPDLDATLPFHAALPPHLDVLTLEQVVSLFVELDLQPAQSSLVRERYGVASGDEVTQLRSWWESRRRVEELDALWRRTELAYRSWRVGSARES